MTPKPDLIFDLGANQGEDTEFYLDKGFRVVAVEANPLLCAGLSERLAEAVVDGRLQLLNIGIWSHAGTLAFYANDDNDHWSSFDRDYGTREGTQFHTVEVACRTLPDLVATHGLPHYLKVDIEGADQHVIAQLRALPGLPDYVSVEEYGVAAIDGLAAAGFTRFQILSQNDKSWTVPPERPREGRYARRASTGKDSGLFGAELPGAWLEAAAAREHYLAAIRAADGTYLGPPSEWWDIHAGR